MTETLQRQWYDTREGFERALKQGLGGLKEIADERHKAGYDRKERLREWYILGHFYFDTCGNTSKILEGHPTYEDFNSYVPQVLTRDELFAAVGEKHMIRSTIDSIPPAVGVCPRCLDGWDLRNVRNYRPVYRHSTEERVHYHDDCYKLKLVQDEIDHFEKLLARTRLPYTELRVIPNGYGRDYPGPWFMVVTNYGPLKIGWRKRVISIHWDHFNVKLDGEEIFEDQEVTKGKSMIHAWGEDAAVDYINRLVWAINKTEDLPPCMSYCRHPQRHDGKCEPMEGR